MKTAAIDVNVNPPRKSAAKKIAVSAGVVALAAATYFSPEIRNKVSREGGGAVKKGLLSALDFVADNVKIFKKTVANKFRKA